MNDYRLVDIDSFEGVVEALDVEEVNEEAKAIDCFAFANLVTAVSSSGSATRPLLLLLYVRILCSSEPTFFLSQRSTALSHPDLAVHLLLYHLSQWKNGGVI